MHRLASCLLPLVLALLAARPAAAQQGLLCRAAIETAERERGIPPRLLQAIALVESGRRDPDTGARLPWPWTVNAEGVGSFHPTRAAAIAHVRMLQARGVRSIDVGCMQVNLRHHPDAFASLEEAFEPLANARYAARFLGELQQARGGWPQATAGYHSSTTELGEPYRARVEAAWAEERKAPAAVRQFASAAPALMPPPRPQAMLPTGAGMFGGGPPPGTATMAGGPGTAGSGRGLDAYRSRPIPLVGRIASAVPIPPGPGLPTGAIGPRRLF